MTAHAKDWLERHAFSCRTLHARITPAQCEQNRNIPEAGAWSLYECRTRPPQCGRCDWREMQKHKGENMDQVENKGADKQARYGPGVCASCRQKKNLHARGLCRACYLKHEAVGTLDKEFPAVFRGRRPRASRATATVKGSAREPGNGLLKLALDFGAAADGEAVMHALLQEALDQYRTPEAQAAWMIRSALGAFKADRVRVSLGDARGLEKLP